jgi:hypothetical protein
MLDLEIIDELWLKLLRITNDGKAETKDCEYSKLFIRQLSQSLFNRKHV